jgi:hypothetical protein
VRAEVGQLPLGVLGGDAPHVEAGAVAVDGVGHGLAVHAGREGHQDAHHAILCTIPGPSPTVLAERCKGETRLRPELPRTLSA